MNDNADGILWVCSGYCNQGTRLGHCPKVKLVHHRHPFRPKVQTKHNESHFNLPSFTVSHLVSAHVVYIFFCAL